MTTLVACTIRGYSAADDTASVELTGAGVIEAWLDGIKIASTINRALVVYNAGGVLTMPDVHRICDAVLTDITPPGGNPALVQPGSPAAGTRLKNQSGRALIQTDNTGTGSVTVTFPAAFNAAPFLYAQADNFTLVTISAVTATQATFSVSGSTHNAFLYVNWYGTG